MKNMTVQLTFNELKQNFSRIQLARDILTSPDYGYPTEINKIWFGTQPESKLNIN